jgi:hypothetical protein
VAPDPHARAEVGGAALDQTSLQIKLRRPQEKWSAFADRCSRRSRHHEPARAHHRNLRACHRRRVRPRASYRFLEFFTARIRNRHTRRAYTRAAKAFFDWLAAKGVRQLADIEGIHVPTYIEELYRERLPRPLPDSRPYPA